MNWNRLWGKPQNYSHAQIQHMKRSGRYIPHPKVTLVGWIGDRLHDVAGLLRKLAIFEILDYARRLTLLAGVISVIFYVSGQGDRHIQQVKASHYQAWEVVNSSLGQETSGGRIEALQDLARDKVPLYGLNARGAYLNLIDLHGADLGDADLSKAKLNGANLSGTSLFNANFSNASLINTDLSDAFLRNANFSGANLQNAKLEGTNVDEANLCNATMPDGQISVHGCEPETAKK